MGTDPAAKNACFHRPTAFSSLFDSVFEKGTFLNILKKLLRAEFEFIVDFPAQSCDFFCVLSLTFVLSLPLGIRAFIRIFREGG